MSTSESRERTALRKSIQHWERLFQYTFNKDVVGIEIEGWHADKCACCTLYYNTKDPSKDSHLIDFNQQYCWKCPIRKISGSYGCRKTPWIEANCSLASYVAIPNQINLEDAKSDVTAELNFLYDVFRHLHPNFDMSTSKTPITGIDYNM